MNLKFEGLLMGQLENAAGDQPVIQPFCLTSKASARALGKSANSKAKGAKSHADFGTQLQKEMNAQPKEAAGPPVSFEETNEALIPNGLRRTTKTPSIKSSEANARIGKSLRMQTEEANGEEGSSPKRTSQEKPKVTVHLAPEWTSVNLASKSTPAIGRKDDTSTKNASKEPSKPLEALPVTANLSKETPPEILVNSPVAPTSSGSGSLEPTPEVKAFVATLPAAALEDPSLRAALLPQVANLTVDTGDSGSLSVRLQVRDGVTDVQMVGPATNMVEARESELRVALAHEGLALGNLDLTQRDTRQNPEREPEDMHSRAPSQPTVASRQETASRNLTSDGTSRVHIQA